MRTICCFFALFLLLIYSSASEAAFWGSAGGGYSSDDNFYKDVFKHENTGYYYTFNLNAKNKLSPVLQYDASYFLLGTKNTDITWEDNLLNNAKLNFLVRPSDVFNIRVLTSFENKTFPDEFSKKYNYNQYRAGIGVPLYIFDHTTPKIGFSYEKIMYNDFDFDSTATGPLVELQHELSPWTMVTLTVSAMTRDYPKQNLYEDITTTTTAERKDMEMFSGITLASVISKDWNLSTGVRYEDIRSNANFSAMDPDVPVSSRTLVVDYYSYTTPSLFFETTFYPSRKVGCLIGATYQEKAYGGRYATDSSGRLLVETRKDKRLILATEVTYRLSGPIMLKADYSYETSSSNDYTYAYSNNIFSTGITIYF